MYTSYRIVVFTINQNDGEAEFTTRVEDRQDAILTFHSQCSSYGKNKATKYCTVMLFDPKGGLERTESFKNETPVEAA